MSKTILLFLISFAFFSSYALDVDFTKPGPQWKPSRGRAIDPALAAKQVWSDAAGLHVAYDAALSDLSPWNWGGIGCVSRVGEFYPGDLVELRAAWSQSGLLAADASLSIHGTNGKRVNASRLSIRRERGEYVFTYRIDPGNTEATPPLALCGIAFGFACEAGEACFHSFKKVVELKDNKTELITEEIEPEACFPWAPPFGPANSIRVELTDPKPGNYAMDVGDLDGQFGKNFRRYWATLAEGETALVFNTATNTSFRSYYRNALYTSKGKRAIAKRITATTPVTRAECLGMDVDTGNAIHVIRADFNERAAIVFTNRSDIAREWKVQFSLFDDSTNRAPERALTIALAPHAIKRFDLPLVPRLGCWRAQALVTADDGSQTKLERTFARLDPHRVTPKLPFGKFRVGVNFHQARYSDDVRQKCYAAFVAAGIKHSRCGSIAIPDVHQLPSGEWDWSTSDKYMKELEDIGVSMDRMVLNIIAIDRYKKNPELVLDFYRQLAARYGERVDYYEFGNEWDLWDADKMTPEQGAEYQKIFCKVLKEVNPKLRIITNGWALENSDSRQVLQKGFQERYMTLSKGYYDYHPIHVHGSWWSFRPRMEKFFRLRRECGITVPWYANETALNNAGGEDLVADCVWKKIIWCWAKGSTDYIWYNLRATGWNPSDGEMLYGLVTADFYPRCGYAAMSALTAVLEGADFVREIEELGKPTLYVFRLADNKGMAIVTWNDLNDSPFNVSVASDAIAYESRDLYGNVSIVADSGAPRTSPPTIVAGEPQRPPVPWQASVRPCVLIARGATRLDASVPGPALVRPTRRISLGTGEPGKCAPDLTLDAYSQVYEIYYANPAMIRRLWQGRDDLSAKAWLRKTPTGLKVLVHVKDDFHSPEDSARFEIYHEPLITNHEPRTTNHEPSPTRSIDLGPAKRIDGLTIYEKEISCDPKAIKFNLIISDADAEGPDGTMSYSRYPVQIAN